MFLCKKHESVETMRVSPSTLPNCLRHNILSQEESRLLININARLY